MAKKAGRRRIPLQRIQVYRDSNKQWRFRIKARNGRIVAVSSEGYKRVSGAWNGVKAAQTALNVGG